MGRAMKKQPANRPSIIGVDADDTLWQSEQFFHFTQQEFASLLADHARPANLLATERRNLQIYGFGIKGFVLSMIETALEVTDGRLPSGVISKIMALGRDMLVHPIETLPGVTETLTTLRKDHKLVLITKGDLFDQERKLAESGLGELFSGVEIVTSKDASAYTRIFSTYGEGPESAVMIGNSLKSDVIPAIKAGSWGVFVPHPLTWVHEHAEEPAEHPKFRKIAAFRELPELLDTLF
jgi:putative hydrolase of the HAD superfamily